jgi:hypothetical protein
VLLSKTQLTGFRFVNSAFSVPRFILVRDERKTKESFRPFFFLSSELQFAHWRLVQSTTYSYSRKRGRKSASSPDPENKEKEDFESHRLAGKKKQKEKRAPRASLNKIHVFSLTFFFSSLLRITTAIFDYSTLFF